MTINVAFWKSYIRQNGVFRFGLLLSWKIYSIAIKRRFNACDDLMLMMPFQVSGWKNIIIGKFTAGPRLRLEALSKTHHGEYAPRIKIGVGVSFGSDAHIAAIKSIDIGDNVLAGSGVVIVDHDHGVYNSDVQSCPTDAPGDRALQAAAISIGSNVHLGDRVIVLKGVSIGPGSIIGAGAVVTKSVPGGAIAVGNPARVVKRYDCAARKWLAAERVRG
jgi:acetyltransferase-like isoleucine patch superfamily enzyme